MKTVFHAYSYNVKEPSDKEAYARLRERLNAMGLKCFEAIAHPDSYYKPKLDGMEIELEDKFLFDNQWNTAPIDGVTDKGLRVFDWAQDYPHQLPHIRRGHWLEQTDEMREARANRVECGYTGKQISAKDAPTFNLDALESEYLKESDLDLIRFRPIGAKWGASTPLTDEERAYLLPLFHEAQTHGRTERGKARAAKLRIEIDHKREEKIQAANDEWKGFDFCLRHGISTANLIYYSHTGKFCFGWRKPLSAGEKSALLEAIGAEFPVDYEIEAEPELVG